MIQNKEDAGVSVRETLLVPAVIVNAPIAEKKFRMLLRNHAVKQLAPNAEQEWFEKTDKPAPWFLTAARTLFTPNHKVLMQKSQRGLDLIKNKSQNNTCQINKII